MGLFKNKYLKYISAVTLITLFIKIFAAFKEIAIAYRYGVGDEIDAYMIAFMYVTFMVTIIGGSLSSAFIPTYVRVRTAFGDDAAKDLVWNVTVFGSVLFFCITIVLAILSFTMIPIISSGFNQAKVSLTIGMTFVMLPILVFMGTTHIVSAVLNAHNRYKLSALTPILPSVSIMVIALLGTHRWGGRSLAYATMIGYFLELCVLTYWVSNQRLLPRIKKAVFDPHTRTVFEQFLPLAVGAMMITGMTIVDQSMAAMLENGSVATLNYGYRFITMIFALSGSLWIVALPKFSEMAVTLDLISIRKSLTKQFKWIFYIFTPVAIIFFYFSEDIVSCLFERGAFTAQDTLKVALVQKLYALQIPFYIGSGLMARVLSSLKFNRIIMFGGAFALMANILFNLLFIRFFQVAGIALSTFVVCLMMFFYLAIVLHYKLRAN